MFYLIVLQAAVCSFFGVKNDPKYIFEKMHNQAVLKTICLQLLDSKYNSSGTGQFTREIQACLCVITSHLYT